MVVFVRGFGIIKAASQVSDQRDQSNACLPWPNFIVLAFLISHELPDLGGRLAMTADRHASWRVGSGAEIVSLAATTVSMQLSFLRTFLDWLSWQGKTQDGELHDAVT